MRAALAALAAMVACASAAQPTVNLTLTHERPVEPQLFGLNSILGTIYAIPFDDPVLQDVVDVMRIGSWRYPGGTVANYYDITAGNYMPNCTKELCKCCATKETISELLPPGAMAADKFMADGAVGTRLQASGPVWDLNVFTQSDANATKQIEFLRRTVPASSVSLLELGNEFYISKNYAWRFPDAASYATAVVPTIKAARAAFPGASIAMVASQIHDASKEGGCGDHTNSWNTALRAAMPPGITDVTMHDYSIGNGTVEKIPGKWQKVAYTLAYSGVMLAEASRGAKQCFGEDTRIWQTEYNYAAGDGGGFNKEHGPLFPGRVNGTIHGAYLVSRMIAAVGDPTYRTMNIMCALAVEGVGWGGHSGIVGLDVDFAAKPVPRVRSAVVTGMAQIYAHLAYLAAPSEGAVTMAGLVQAEGAGPVLNLTVEGVTGLPCLQGAVFLGARRSAGPASVRPVLINRCPEPVVAMVGAGSASGWYEGYVTTYDTSDEGGSAPLPSKAAPFPWPGPLRKTTSTRVQGLLPLPVEVPGLSLVMAELSLTSR